MEQARRAYWEGKSVLYLCYNHNIAQYVQYQFEKDRVYIEAVTLHAFMMRTCGVEWSPNLSQHFMRKNCLQLLLWQKMALLRAAAN